MSGGGPVSTRKLYVHVSLIYLLVVIFLGNQGVIILPTIYSHCRLITDSQRKFSQSDCGIHISIQVNFTMLRYSNKGSSSESSESSAMYLNQLEINK